MSRCLPPHPHLRTETDPVSEKPCFLVRRIPDDGKSKKPGILKINRISKINYITANNLSQESRSSERELNLLPFEYEAGMPPFVLRLSLTRCIISYLELFSSSCSGSNILHLFLIVIIFTLKHKKSHIQNVVKYEG
jgi:hypothetical protein